MKMPLPDPGHLLRPSRFRKRKSAPTSSPGIPTAVVPYPITGTVVPAWWAWRSRQRSTSRRPSTTGCWDYAPRHDHTRAAVVEDKYCFSYDSMGFPGHRSLGNEEVYDHGYGLALRGTRRDFSTAYETLKSHLHDQLRDARWNRLYHRWRSALQTTPAGKKKGNQLYDDWKAYLTQRARQDAGGSRVARICAEGKVLSATTGSATSRTASFSPDGMRVALLIERKGGEFRVHRAVHDRSRRQALRSRH